MKHSHLKMYIDRLMLVPRKPMDEDDGATHSKSGSIGEAGAKMPNPKTKLGHEKEMMEDDAGMGKHHEVAREQGRDTMPDDDYDIDLSHGDDEAAPLPPKEHEGSGGMESSFSKKDAHKQDHMHTVEALNMEHGKDAMPKGGIGKPQTAHEPGVTLTKHKKQSEYEKHVESERSRHRKIFGD